jgi:2-dehydropantoate 2-reductase
MRIAIYGTGGVGAAFGSRLALAGQEVAFLARGAHLAALRQQGLTVVTPTETLHVQPIVATDDPAEIGPVDAVLIALKTWQLQAAAATLGPMLGPETFVVPLQNGVEAADVVAAAIGPERVIGGTCGTISFIESPGVIRTLGRRNWLVFGELDRRPSERTRRLLAAFEGSGAIAEISDDIHVALWEKFAFVVPLGGVGAVARASIGECRSVPETRRLLEDGVREIVALAGARGIPVAADLQSNTMAAYDRMLPDGTSSMQRDLLAGRPSELDAWNGAVVRLAGASGIDVPTHAFLFAALLPLHRRGMASLGSSARASVLDAPNRPA